MNNEVDVLIIGAGLSGIGMACHLTREKTGRTYLILERRTAIGGTWDLFRYPGVRSDSDMFTFGYNFRPWTSTRVLADGPGIRRYIEDTAAEYNVTDYIRFGRRVTKAAWSSSTNRWTVDVVDESTGIAETYTANFLVGATGYYDYDNGYRPRFPGEEDFAGTIVHPQHWPEDLDYGGKRVVVIGSGATAITLVPAMCADAAHVTMLQRSPTYIAAIPAVDKITAALHRARVPAPVVHAMGRARNIALYRASFELSRANPALVRNLLLRQARARLGRCADVRHFTPSYDPWDQRLCVAPDGDLFTALRRADADIVTDRIEAFTERGIRLESGTELEADIIVTATGLNMQMLGGARLEVDEQPQVLNELLTYKGVMLGNVPNFAIIVGYTNASWTLRADLSSEWICRLLNHMRENDLTRAVAVPAPGDRTEHSILGWALTSGYIQRGDGVMPRQGTRGPWRLVSNFYRDWVTVRHNAIEDGILRLDRPHSSRSATLPAGAASQSG